VYAFECGKTHGLHFKDDAYPLVVMSLTKGSQADYQGTQNRLQRLKHFCMIDFICKVLFLEAWCKVSKRKKESDLTKIWTILLRKRNRFLLDRTTSSCNYLYSSTRKSKQYFV